MFFEWLQRNELMSYKDFIRLDIRKKHNYILEYELNLISQGYIKVYTDCVREYIIEDTFFDIEKYIKDDKILNKGMVIYGHAQ